MAPRKSRNSAEELDIDELQQESTSSKKKKDKVPVILMLSGVLDADTHQGLVHELLSYHFSPDFNDTVTIVINSPGGEADVGWAIIDTMNFVRYPIQTTAVGFAASAAADIFCNGDIRVMGAHSLLMIHDTAMAAAGAYQDLVAQRKCQDLDHERGVLHYVNNSKYKTAEEVKQHLLVGRDLYLNPQEAIAHGLCDNIAVPNKSKRPKLTALPKKTFS